MSDVPRGHILVRFLTMCPPYNPEETAALPYARSKSLVECGAALYVDPPAGVDAAGAVKDNKPSLPGGVTHKGGGYYVVGVDEDGNEIIVKGKEAALEAAALALDPATDDDSDPDPDPDPDADEGDGDPDPDPED